MVTDGEDLVMVSGDDDDDDDGGGEEWWWKRWRERGVRWGTRIPCEPSSQRGQAGG